MARCCGNRVLEKYLSFGGYSSYMHNHKNFAHNEDQFDTLHCVDGVRGQHAWTAGVVSEVHQPTLWVAIEYSGYQSIERKGSQ